MAFERNTIPPGTFQQMIFFDAQIPSARLIATFANPNPSIELRLAVNKVIEMSINQPTKFAIELGGITNHGDEGPRLVQGCHTHFMLTRVIEMKYSV